MERNVYFNFLDTYAENENPQLYGFLNRKYFMFPLLSGSFLPLNNNFFKKCVFLYQTIKTTSSILFIIMLYKAAIEVKDYSISISFINLIMVFLVLASIICNVVQLFMRKLFCQIHEMTLDGSLFHYTYGIDSKTMEKVHWNLKFYERTVYANIFSFFCGGCALILFKPLTREMEGYSNEQVQSYCGSPLWYLVDLSSDMLTNNRIYYAISIWQFCNTGLDLSIGLLSYNFFIGSWINEAEILMRSIRSVEERATSLFHDRYNGENFWSSDDEMYRDEKFMECYSKCLIENVKHHQLLMRYSELCKKFISMPALILFVIATVNLSCGMLVFRSEDRFYTVKIAVVVDWVNTILAVSVVALYGQRTKNLADDLKWAIYGLKWYRCNKSARVLIRHMQIAASKPIILKAKMLPIDFNTLADIFKSSYTFFNVVEASLKKHN